MASQTCTNSSSGVVDTPEQYLKLATTCMEQALSICTSTKINHEQCEYLAIKLKLVVKRAYLFLELMEREEWSWTPASPDEKAKFLEIFKVLFALAMEVESFIENCCKDGWIQAAVILAHVWEHILSMGFNMELCALVFSNKWEVTLAYVESLSKAEAEIVKKKASIDEEALVRQLKDFLESSNSASEECELARYLLQRLSLLANCALERTNAVLGVYSQQSSSMTSTTQTWDSQQSSLSTSTIRALDSEDMSFYERDVLSMDAKMEKLGKGSFGEILKGVWLGVKVAVKVFFGRDSPDFKNEVSTLVRLCHPNIIPLFCYGEDKDTGECSIVMELMDGDLHSLMKERIRGDKTRKTPFTILEGIGIMLQIAHGMDYLHSMKIVHRDLKSHNILLKCTKTMSSRIENVQVKVADFGLSRTKERSMSYSNQTLNVGTTRWMAPELIRSGNFGKNKKYPRKTDVYSFGMVCYEILTGKVPFQDISSLIEVKKRVLCGDRPKLPEECPDTLKTLIEKCWNLEASTRPCFGDICAELKYLKSSELNCMTCFAASTSGRGNQLQNQQFPKTSFSIKEKVTAVASDVFKYTVGLPITLLYRRKGRMILYKFQQRFEELDVKPIIFSYNELCSATRDFHSNMKLNEGGFVNGVNMYKGILSNGSMVAVKQLQLLSKDALEKVDDFLNEVELITGLMHRNLIQLKGCCLREDQVLMVYEYADNFDVYHILLAGPTRVHLSWPIRLQICLGVALGLHYLHALAQPKIIHRNIKAANILLNKNYDAKIANFKQVALNEECETNLLAGTRGYWAPEYVCHGQLSDKVDVYSFGVLCLEIISGRIVFNHNLPSAQVWLTSWAWDLYRKGNFNDLVDSTLLLQDDEMLAVQQVIRIALLCIQHDARRRPSMDQVVSVLQRDFFMFQRLDSSIL